MSQSRRERIESIFDAAVVLAPPERRAFLESICGSDLDLLAEVQGLVRASEGATGEVAQRLVRDAAQIGCEIQSERRIGPYILLSQLGEGGFGVVHLAERREPHKQRVALKILKPGMDSKAVVARFEQERQALAVMDHPNIARVFDAGVTDEGRPFFVMEYVKGEPITDYCDRRRLLIPERLEVFCSVCEAIQHAHSKGVIHRDIKPGNILVAAPPEGADGVVGIPKVIDFGIAKAISQAFTSKTIFTQHGQFIGTPAYMSPEQAEMGATDIDTRSDVYSLGALLYELLVGAAPFDFSGSVGNNYLEIQHIVRESDPVRPSARLMNLGGDADTTALSRGLRVDDLARFLRRELEWIPMYAMRKDRAKRYQTPLELAQDVRNYLAGRPLVAGPESAAYRIRKLANRNRGAVAAAIIVGVGILLGGGGLAAGLLRARAAEREAALERDTLQAINEFLVTDLLSAAQPLRLGRDVKVTDVLAAAAESVPQRFANRADIGAELHATVGQSFLRLGVLGAAETELRAALDLLSAQSDASVSLKAQVSVNLAEVLWRQGRPAEAVALLTPLYDQFLRQGDASHSALWSVLDSLASAHKRLGNTAESERLYTEALVLMDESLDPDARPVLKARYNLALLLLEKGDLAAATDAMATVAVDIEQSLSDADPLLSYAWSELASMYARAGERGQAVLLYARALPSMRSQLGDRHWRTLELEANYGRTLHHLERWDEAIIQLADAVAGYRDVRGVLHADTWAVTRWFHETAVALGEFAEAERVLLEAYAYAEDADPPDDTHMRAVATEIVSLYRSMGREDEADAWSLRLADRARSLDKSELSGERNEDD